MEINRKSIDLRRKLLKTVNHEAKGAGRQRTISQLTQGTGGAKYIVPRHSGMGKPMTAGCGSIFELPLHDGQSPSEYLGDDVFDRNFNNFIGDESLFIAETPPIEQKIHTRGMDPRNNP